MRARKRLDRGVNPKQTDTWDSLPLYKRKERLTELALAPLDPSAIKPGHVVMAIKELNLMEHVYDPSPPHQDNRQILIVVGDEAGKLALQKLLNGGTRPSSAALGTGTD